MKDNERYENVDMPFYRKEVLPFLPEEILDFHAHSWLHDQWLITMEQKKQAILNKGVYSTNNFFPSAKYMSTELEYSMGNLLNDAARIFPQQRYHAVVFGNPTPAADVNLTNNYIESASSRKKLYPLIVTGKDMIPKDILKQKVVEAGFFGYKVFINWIGNNYGRILIDDMIGPNEMDIANELRLVVLLHVPRAERLADPEIAKGVRKLAQNYPGANFVLAHCGRCYMPEQMGVAVNYIADLDNVYLDTSMVMDSSVLHILFSSIKSQRVLFGTDFPVASMRGRRVNIMDHWVDIVLEGYPECDYRVVSKSIRASFMAYEIILAIKIAADTAGLTKEQLEGVFFQNGISLLGMVKGGKQRKKMEDKECGF